jgi:hypothetical protein
MNAVSPASSFLNFGHGSLVERISFGGLLGSPSAVEPVTSQNKTVTTFRCSCPGASARAPHSGQNLKESAAS